MEGTNHSMSACKLSPALAKCYRVVASHMFKLRKFSAVVPTLLVITCDEQLDTANPVPRSANSPPASKRGHISGNGDKNGSKLRTSKVYPVLFGLATSGQIYFRIPSSFPPEKNCIKASTKL